MWGGCLYFFKLVMLERYKLISISFTPTYTSTNVHLPTAGKEGTGSHLVTIPPGPHLSDALVSSAIVQVVTPVTFT